MKVLRWVNRRVLIATNHKSGYGKPIRVLHDRERMRAFWEALPAASKIALEPAGVTIGGWTRWSEPANKRSWRIR